MVAYSFQKQFGPPIKAGTKTGTIRADRKRHAREGENLQLFTGMRTKYCQKIIPDPVCQMVMPISLHVQPERMGHIMVGKADWLLHPTGETDFAMCDGFNDMREMHAFWLKTHGPGLFEGFWIAWADWAGNGLKEFFQ